MHAATPSPPYKLSARRSGFSLIELLVVVGIIAILASLILPAVSKMKTQSMRTRAAGQVSAVANAVKMYRQTYGRWPGQTTSGADGNSTRVTSVPTTAPVLSDLTNRVTNARGEQFLDIKENWLLGGELVDPWKRRLVIAMDEDADGTINVTATSPEAGGASKLIKINHTIAVMSWGPDPKDDKLRVNSWTR